MLETFLSGASFTDMLAVMSTQLDAAEQDRVLAQQIAAGPGDAAPAPRDGGGDPRARPTCSARRPAVQKQKLDRRMEELRKQQARLKALEKAAKAALAEQKAEYQKLAADKKKLREAIAAAAAARKKLQSKIDKLVDRQFQYGNIPSAYNGTLGWPMAGHDQRRLRLQLASRGTAPGNGCAHFHNGIDIVAPYGTPVRASGAGRVVYCGWNYADGADPAWIVIIAHSSELSTWYAHMTAALPRRRRVSRQEGPGHRARGQHGPLHRRAPALDGPVQRELREPAAVHVGRAARPAPAVTLRSPRRNPAATRRC